MICFRLPLGRAAILRTPKGFETFDESIHCLQSIARELRMPPRAVSMKLRRKTLAFGLKSTSFDPEFEIKPNLLTVKHVDDIHVAGTEKDIDEYTKMVEREFGKCKLSKH